MKDLDRMIHEVESSITALLHRDTLAMMHAGKSCKFFEHAVAKAEQLDNFIGSCLIPSPKAKMTGKRAQRSPVSSAGGSSDEESGRES